jgi:acyl carrier protein
VENTRQAVRDKITELAAGLGNDATDLKDDDVIPDAGLLDSSSIVELVVWIEDHLGVRIEDAEITVDNLGSIAAIERFVTAKHHV